ncbi:MAG: L,D-transpeptidase family protein [Pseudomonadota bacterium]|nr:L,D-transpeptidase family protein [Pseudomonadota bacterium]
MRADHKQKFPLARTAATLALATGLVASPAIGSIWSGAGLALAQNNSLPGVQIGAEKPQNLFEALFPDLIQQRLRRERALNPPVEVEKISAPKYFTYKPDALVRIDLSSLVPAEETAPTLSPAAAGPQDLDGTGGNEEGARLMSPPAEDARETFDRVLARFGAVEVMAEPAIARAVVDYYENHGELLWLDADMQPDARARSVLPVLAAAGKWGLDPRDYHVDPPSSGADALLAEEEAARFEVELTARVLRYGMDAAAGRIDPNKLSGYHDFPENRIRPSTVLDKLLAGGLPARVLVDLHPDNAPFLALKRELAALSKQAASEEIITIPSDTLIKPGESHAEVGNVVRAIARKGTDELRATFAALLAGPAPESFTPEVVDLVKAFQKEQGLGVDGVVGRNTVSRLTDVSVAEKRERVLLAMERLRWHPHDLGETRVFINQPAFRATFQRNGVVKADMRVIVGTPANQTSFFHDVIETIEYNPYWGIPRSILVNEYLPKLRQNPAYLDERVYIVTDAKGRRIPSAAIDWYSVGSKPPFDVRQLPGEANALGELKILFPNKHAIYMHDTPTNPLFQREVRAFSHGCVRLHQPREMAAAVLGSTVEHVRERLGQGHNSEDVPGNIPVYVAYFTAWPGNDGKVGYFADIYERDQRLKLAVEATRGVRAPTS